MAITGTSFELIPHKLVVGGAALGYHEGQAVLVPNALPGERLERLRIRESKGVVQARVQRLLLSASGGCFQNAKSAPSTQPRGLRLPRTPDR